MENFDFSELLKLSNNSDLFSMISKLYEVHEVEVMKSTFLSNSLNFPNFKQPLNFKQSKVLE